MCLSIGVHIESALLGETVAIVPLQSWYCRRDLANYVTSESAIGNFDAMCNWPIDVGDPTNKHNSVRSNKKDQISYSKDKCILLFQGFPRIAEFFSELNASALSYDFKGRSIVSFSHFVPDPRLCPGVCPGLIPILCAPKLLDHLEILKPTVHIFGHSHINVDIILDNVRFVQNGMVN
jgi:hypothetical protein